MIGQRPFRPADLYWLAEDPPAGEAERAALARAPRLCVPRALCRHHCIEFPPATGARTAARAARLHAEANGPFTESNYLIVRGRGSVGVWWWDAAAVRRALGDARVYRREDCLPETLVQIPGEGARCVALRDGFEAQIWEAGDLRASSWRRKAFTPDQWAAFALGAGRADVPAPAPAPVEADPRGRSVARIVAAPISPADVQKAALRVAAAGALAATFFAAAGASWSRQASEAQAALARAEAAHAADPTIARARADAAALAAFRAQSPDHDALAAAARGLALLSSFNAPPRVWSVRKGVFEAEWSLDGPAAPPNTIAAAFEADPLFSKVAPRVDSQTRRVTLAADISSRGAAR